jgi:phosphopantothenoylcysteine decarboxylase / phosphopantothenate---cysteine ligase
MGALTGKRILLVIGGGIAAYKALELVRRLKEDGARVRAILSEGGAKFITALSVAALTGEKAYSDLFSLTDETEMGHIRLSREADLVLVAPATANLIAKMAGGIADDLATAALLASDKPVMIAPAMNAEMWAKAATQRNVHTLKEDGIRILAPSEGDLACGEVGPGRMMEPEIIREAVRTFFKAFRGPLAGLKALVTAGPTFEPIDPVRFLGNRSSGRQGFAIARALAARSAETVLVAGPSALETPEGVLRLDVATAEEMWDAVNGALPADIAVCAAAVSDWRAKTIASEKIKKGGAKTLSLALERTPDILESLGKAGNRRPRLLVGFAAETGQGIEKATEKRAVKNADWMLANDVGEEGVMGGEENRVTLITAAGAEPWQRTSKAAVADRLAQKISDHFRPHG